MTSRRQGKGETYIPFSFFETITTAGRETMGVVNLCVDKPWWAMIEGGN
jgi:hypothetical protein